MRLAEQELCGCRRVKRQPKGERGTDPSARKHTDTNVAVIIDIPPSLILAEGALRNVKYIDPQRAGKMCWVAQFD